MSTALLIRFCIERVKDKRNGVAENRPVFVLSKSEIACIIVLAVSFISFLVSIVFMCYRGIIPDGVTAVLFLVGIAGYIAGSLWARLIFVKQSSERAKQKYQQIPAEEEKVRKEYERQYKNFWDNLVLPDGFCEFLDEYSNGQNDKKVILSKEDPKDTFVEGINFFRLYNVCPSEKLKEYNDRVILGHKTRMYRNVVAFADDGKGECLFFLDYEYGNEPLINVMNEKRNTGYYVAGSFGKFRQKLVTGKKANELIGKDYYQ